MWIVMALSCILIPEVTVKGFRKCFASSAMSGTDNNMLWSGSKEDGNVRSGCEEDKGTACEDDDGDIDWQRWIESDILCILCI
jgi:hypothetical protein